MSQEVETKTSVPTYLSRGRETDRLRRLVFKQAMGSGCEAGVGSGFSIPSKDIREMESDRMVEGRRRREEGRKVEWAQLGLGRGR